MLKRIAILGEIGSGNLGDDLGYVLLRDELRQAFEELDILTDIRPLTPNMFGLLDSYHWDAVVTGCGTLMDLAGGTYVQILRRCAERQKVGVAILGSGLSDLRHMRFTHEGRVVLEELCHKARHVWLRTVPEGLDPGYAGPDPAWLYGWRREDARQRVIGINVGYAGFSTLDLDPRFIHTLQAVRALLPERTRLFSAWRNDLPWLTRLQAPGEAIYPLDTRVDRRQLNGCSAVLSTRIHLGVIAACHGAFPVLPFYAQKVADVFAQTTVPHKLVWVDDGPQALVETLTLPRDTDPQAAVETAQAACKARVRVAAAALREAWA